MNSCLYECSVMHHRFAPKVHHFQHALFMFYLDLDELDFVARKILCFSHNRKNLYAFHDADHEPSGAHPLKERIIGFLHQNGIKFDPAGRVMLLTLPRVAGYVFNPISIYYCFDLDEKPLCCVAEVGNTFREMKLYLLPSDALNKDQAFRKIVPKFFYVSPFSSLDLDFDFQLRVPGKNLDLKIDDLDQGEKTLITSLFGARTELTNRNLFWFTIKYPFVTLSVIFLIHWQALRLWFKRVPIFRKAANVPQQREVLRPHSTLTARTK